MRLTSRVPKDLLDELDERFPDQCPSIQDSEREIWMKAGRRDVIRMLIKQFELQNENVLDEKTL